MKKIEELKICYVGSPPIFTKGASAIHMMKMCQAMVKMGIDLELVFPSYDRNKDIFKFYGIKNRFKITSIPLTSFFARQIVHGFISSLYVFFNRKKYDLVITRNILFTFISTVFFKIPTIYDAHHPPVNKFAKYIFKLFKDSEDLIRFVTNSKGLGDIYFLLGLNKEKHIVAHNGVDLEDFSFDENKEEIRSKLDLPIEKKIVCYCGNTYKGRGIEHLVSIASDNTDLIFLVVGGRHEDNLIYKKLSDEKKLENFLVKGFVRHSYVPLYLKAADILVLPYTTSMTIRSGSEATEFTSPIKLFEYMASGNPIVATSLPTVVEILDDQENAVLVDPDSKDSLEEGILFVLNNYSQCKAFAHNALTKVEEYTWEGRVRKILGGV